MNRIVGIELSHRFAPIAIREQLAFNKDQTRQALNKLKQDYDEVFVLSTCNRLSVYAFGDGYDAIVKFFNEFGNFSSFLSVMPDSPIAVQNLFSTAAGLESQAIGEHQIIGQIKESLELAREVGSIGPVLDELIRKSIYVGKKVRKETNIGKYSASLATVGFELIKKHQFDLANSKVLLIGTGNMANLIATILDRESIGQLFVASHHNDRAADMAKEWNGQPISMGELHTKVFDADIIIGGTQGEINILAEKELPESKCTRARFALGIHSPKLFIDFGVPRNFNEDLKEYDNISLYDLDDIKKLTFESLEKRYEEIPKARNIVNEEVDNYESWYDHRKVAPVLKAYSNNLDGIREDALKWLLPKMGNLDAKQKQLLERYTHRLIRKISKEPIEGIKKMGGNLPEQDNPINTVKNLFDLKEVDIYIPKRKVIIGSRGSKLALAQANMVIESLKEIEPGYQFILQVIRTSGDEGNLNVMGAFTTAIQRSLLDGVVDLAIHSAKDLPIEDVNGLRISGIPEREDPRDVLLLKDRGTFEDLKTGAIVGTSSLRRAIQMKKLRPDVEIKHIQGNVDSRIKKMESGEYDAIILAAAGLNRLHLQARIDHYFDVHDFLPAAAQGALAIETRDEKNHLWELVEELNHEPTSIAVHAERTTLKNLGGGCNAPIGVFGELLNDEFVLHGNYGDDNGAELVSHKVTGSIKDSDLLAAQLASKLQDKLKHNASSVVREAASS